MRSLLSLLLTLILNVSADAQILTQSHLPIVVIDTDLDQTGQPLEIPDEPRVLANMRIVWNPGGINHLSSIDSPSLLHYNGRISIEVRGSSSQMLDKKGYGLTTLLADGVTNNNVALLGMPKENDWVLNGLAFDPSLIRDYLSYNLSQAVGQYAPRVRYCELVVNGDYRGVYLFQEKIKADTNRVNIQKITTEDVAGEAVTGGYITKADKTTGADPVAWSMSTYTTTPVQFIHDWPKPEEVTQEQHLYIRGQFFALALDAQFHNPSPVTGYPSLIDVPTFIDFMIVNELASNADAYQLSTYFHKDRNGKLRAGPVWDHNLTYGNDLFFWGFDRSWTNIWQFDNGDNTGARFWRDLYQDQVFRCLLAKRFNELIQPGNSLNISELESFIDNTVAELDDAVGREQARWGTVSDFDNQIQAMKSWLSDRISWMQMSMGSFEACADMVMPPLVISRIHYNPDETTAFPDSDAQEFIEITNAGNEVVDLTGVYFRELGFTYVFPPGSEILPSQKLILANDPVVFEQRFGFAPFGKFTRNLSNKSQKLILADPFGNIIDEVTYLDTSPWPNADGNGYYLQLMSLELDNSLPESWQAISDNLLSTSEVASDDFAVYPVPAVDRLSVVPAEHVERLSLYDLSGRLIREISGSQMNLIGLSDGVFILHIHTGEFVVARRVVHYSR